MKTTRADKLAKILYRLNQLIQSFDGVYPIAAKDGERDYMVKQLVSMEERLVILRQAEPTWRPRPLVRRKRKESAEDLI